jgi:TfoX/Sxy family transcriptional regulator of competence genes
VATSQDFKDYIEEQFEELGHVRFKKMFGEYGVFYYEKMVGVLADNKLYIKPTEEGKKHLDDMVLEKFYEGGKPYFLIENTDHLKSIYPLIQTTYDVLPAPKVKQKKKVKQHEDLY